eukprot:TRINITY_DN39440_c0_g2_i2.p1 TRINITY_DN39440_c0_g2~~TRINITY_DN39440_c0_g2_i2.p1  ORF type:complete len:421 (-),score=61.06 TRINITY_DN39440_c0_g2_i2:21-1283(-)
MVQDLPHSTQCQGLARVRLHTARDVTLAVKDLGRQKRWQSISCLLSSARLADIELNQVTFGVVLSALHKSAVWHAAVTTYQEFLDAGIPADTQVVNTISLALTTNDFWRKALYLNVQMQGAAVQSDIVTCSALCTGCAMPWRLPVRWLGMLAHTGILLDAVCHSQLLGAQHRGQKWKAAMLLHRQARTQGLQQDIVAHTSTMNSMRLWKRSLTMLVNAASQSLRVDLQGVTAATTALEHAGGDAAAAGSQWDMAVKLIAASRKRALRLDRIVCQSVQAAARRALQWCLAVDDMMGFAAPVDCEVLTAKVLLDTTAWRHSVQGLESAQSHMAYQTMMVPWSLALLASEKIRTGPASLDAIDLCRLVSLHKDSGRWEWAMRQLELGCELRLQADVVTGTAALGAAEKAGTGFAVLRTRVFPS